MMSSDQLIKYELYWKEPKNVLRHQTSKPLICELNLKLTFEPVFSHPMNTDIEIEAIPVAEKWI